jgi:hypothetical protein
MSILTLENLKYASLSQSERDSADAYAGPHKSFPLYKNGEHLKAAWDLAGHSDNPAETRARILAFAREHGLEGHLPADAQKHMAKKANQIIAALNILLISKARTEDIANLLQMAFNHEEMEGDTFQQGRLVHWAKQHGQLQHLPASAHSIMHQEGVVHEHEGIQNDEYGNHEHVVQKAFASMSLVAKAMESGLAVIEGWVSTPDRDLEKDVVEPEAFTSSIEGYASRGMPLSSEHNTTSYPVGHGQRIALVRNGSVFKSAEHPVDAAEFEHFPHAGTGVYGRFLITEPTASGAVQKGNVRGFSWIGKPAKTEPLPGGGRKMLVVEPWYESTIAAYPINSKATMVAAH